MHEEAAASTIWRAASPGKGVVELTQSFKGLAEQDAEKPGHSKASENAGFGESLEVVVSVSD